MTEMVRIYLQAEMDAVRNNEIEGDWYQDGEVWADYASLLEWRKNHQEITNA